VVLIAQAAVGYTQYFTGDPALLVGFHLAGATSVVVAMVAFYMSLYAREPHPQVQTVSEVRQGPRALIKA
jgi:cytochrome c oxidase assembly protein subunit 15